MPDPVLAADIGGTHARFLYGAGELQSASALELTTRDHTDLTALLTAALAVLGQGERSHTDAVLAVAGPVGSGSATLTNLPWTVDAAALQRHFGLRRVTLINDLEAAARCLAEAPLIKPTVLRVGISDMTQRCAVISVSTGLGVAYWSRQGGRLRVDAAEAGHAGFAPGDGWEMGFMGALEQRHQGRVSWERVLSGTGLSLLDAHLREAEPRTPADVARQAVGGETSAVAAVRRYSRLLGVFAGDMALAAPALGGVWLMGGVLAGLGAAFDRQAFLEGFDAKGRLSPRLATVPIHMTEDDGLGVRGAWVLARSQAP